MTRLEPDVAFERALFDSARHDGPSEEQKRAAYEAIVTSGTLIAASGVALSHGHRLFDLGTAKVAAWVTAGALVGSGITIALLEGRAPRPTTPALPAQMSAPSNEARLAEPVPRPSSVLLEPPLETENSPSPSASAPVAPNAKTPETKSRVHREIAETSSSGSTLSREVAALDHARSALWQSDFQSTLRRVEAFHAEFPRSALAPDAESLAIEALRGLGDAHAAAGRAERFLLRYPNDPQAPRIREGDERP